MGYCSCVSAKNINSYEKFHRFQWREKPADVATSEVKHEKKITVIRNAWLVCFVCHEYKTT